jgi:hypothetical protein
VTPIADAVDPAEPPERGRLAARFRDALSRLRLSPADAGRRWGVPRGTIERLCAGDVDHPIVQRRLAAALVDAELRLLVAGPEECPDIREALRPNLERLAEAAERSGWEREKVERGLRGVIGTDHP